MNLNEEIRSRSRELHDGLLFLSNEIKELEQQKSSLHMQIERAKDEEDSEKPHIHKEEEKIRTLEKEIARLRDEITKKSTEALELSEGLQKDKEKIGTLKKEKERLSLKLDQTRNEIRKKEEKQKEIEARLLDARKNAFSSYLNFLNKSIVDLNSEYNRHKEKISARKDLDASRHSDPIVMDLMEAKESWEKIIESPVASSVKKTAQIEHDKIIKEIEHRFPGALSCGLDFNNSEIQELYYLKPSDSRLILFLPIKKYTWKSIEVGESGPENEMIVKLAWALSNHFDLKSSIATFKFESDFCTLDFECIPENLESFNFSLNQETSISFIFSELPEELKGIVSQ